MSLKLDFALRCIVMERSKFWKKVTLLAALVWLISASRLFADLLMANTVPPQQRSIHSSNAEKVFEKGLRLIRQDDLENALTQMEKIADSKLKSDLKDDAIFYAGWISWCLGNKGQLRTYFQRLAYYYPESEWSDDALIFLAESDFEAGNYVRASIEYSTLISRFPYSENLHDAEYGLGQSRFAQDRFLQAIENFERFISDFGESPLVPSAQFQIGQAYFYSKAYDKAVGIFDKIADNGRDYNWGPSVFYNLGICYVRLKRYDNAIGQFTKLIQQFPASSEASVAYLELGNIYFENKRFSEAIKAFEKYLRKPTGPESEIDAVRLKLEKAYFETGLYQNELDIALNFVRKYPASSLAGKLQLEIGDYYRVGYQFEKAILAYRKVLSNPKWKTSADQASMNIAECLLNLERSEEAIKELSSLVSRSINSSIKASALLKIGDIYRQQERYDMAVEAYEEVLSTYGEESQRFKALLGIARCYEDLSKWEEARYTFQRAMREYPKDFFQNGVSLRLSNVYYKQGRLSNALKAAYDAISSSPPPLQAELYLFIGDIWDEMGKTPKSVDTYQRIVRDFSKTDAAGKALIKLGDIALRTGKQAEALRAYRQASQDVENVSIKKQAKDKLKELGDNIR